MADRDGGPVARPAQPGAMRSFLRGLRISVVRVPLRHGLPFKNTDPSIVRRTATATAMAGGFVTMSAGSPEHWQWNHAPLIVAPLAALMSVGSPERWQWNIPTDTGVAIMCATTGTWVAYGFAKGGAAVVRHTVERGRRDLIQHGAIE